MAKEAKNKKDNNKNKKSFFKDFKAELKKVIWPTPNQLVNSTVAVITIVLLTAAIVFVLDLAFEALNKQGIDKVKHFISQENVTSENTTVENTSGENTDEANSTESIENTIVEDEANYTAENSENNTETSTENIAE